jgi:hypothetical protein
MSRIGTVSGLVLWRTGMCPSGKAASSMQVPLLPLKLLVRQWMRDGSGVVTGVSGFCGCHRLVGSMDFPDQSRQFRDYATGQT